MQASIHLQSSFKHLLNKHEYSTYDVPGFILSALQILTHLILNTPLWVR